MGWCWWWLVGRWALGTGAVSAGFQASQGIQSEVDGMGKLMFTEEFRCARPCGLFFSLAEGAVMVSG